MTNPLSRAGSDPESVKMALIIVVVLISSSCLIVLDWML